MVITAPAANQVLSYNSSTSQWVNGAVNLSNNTDIVDLKKKLFLLEKFGAVNPTVKTPPSPVPWNDADGNVYNTLSADIFVSRNTWSGRIYSSVPPTTSVPSAQLFENTSGYAIDLIIKVSITTSADDQTQFKMLINSTTSSYSYSDIQTYNGAGYQRQSDQVYTYTARVPAGETYRFEMEGLVGSGSNGRGLDLVAGIMIINFGAWA